MDNQNLEVMDVDGEEELMHGTLLLIDDDVPFLRQMERAMSRRGFEVTCVEGVKEATALLDTFQPDFAVVDLRLADGSGLDVIKILRKNAKEESDTRVIMLTGYGNLTTAVSAVKMGAVDYLAKPTDADTVMTALLNTSDQLPEPPENPMSADRVRWEHIQRVFEMCNRNVSETARRLNMHRRTLQRILAKRSPK
jgi:two-component system response regulator RegA